MYNRLFTKILDSSIWLEPDTTRIVWITILAVMDEDSFVQIATPENLAIRARVRLEDCIEAIRCLESPDPRAFEDEFEGRRIERVPGGWLVLKGQMYRDIFKKEIMREQTRVRVAECRAKKKASEEGVTGSNGEKQFVTQSVAVATATAQASATAKPSLLRRDETLDEIIASLRPLYPHLNVDAEVRKAKAHLLLPKCKGRRLTRRFITGWLNRCDTPIEFKKAKPKPDDDYNPEEWNNREAYEAFKKQAQ